MSVIYDNGKYQVETNGDTLWINTHTMLGRFSPRGSDVHVGGECRPDTCTSKPSWHHFVKGMKKHHNIDVSPFKVSLDWDVPEPTSMEKTIDEMERVADHRQQVYEDFSSGKITHEEASAQFPEDY